MNTSSRNVSLLTGDGAGGFTATTPFGIGSLAVSLATGDLDHDGDLDAVVANLASDTVSVLLGNGAGGFTPHSPVPTVAIATPSSVALGDLNGDGYLDALVASQTSDNVRVLINTGGGGFLVSTAVGVGDQPNFIALGDVNGDGDLDALVTNRASGTCQRAPRQRRGRLHHRHAGRRRH